MTENGPIYGVELIDVLPVMGGMKQALPSHADLVKVRRVSERTVAGYEVLLAAWRDQHAEIERLRKHLHRFVKHLRDERPCVGTWDEKLLIEAERELAAEAGGDDATP